MARHAKRVDELEQKVAALSAKVDKLFLGAKAFLFLMLVLASSVDLRVTFSIGFFRQLFAEALPGQILPAWTTAVFALQIPFIVLAFVWPLSGIAALCVRARTVLSLSLLAGALMGVVVQGTVISTAMFAPLVMGLVSTPTVH